MLTKTIRYFFDEDQNSFENNVESCYLKLIRYIQEKELTADNCALISIFVRSDSNDYKWKKDIIEFHTPEIFQNIPVAIIAQAPYNHDVVLELITIEGEFLILSSSKNYKLFDFQGNHELYSEGIYGEDILSCFLAAGNVFTQIEEILEISGFSKNNIVRQWNYIENILTSSDEDGETKQNYQIFNDIRSFYFDKEQWVQGYPAATGIGSQAGGIASNIIASNASGIYPIKNPVQTDAHQYSQNVLVGSSKVNKKTTPKFERSKIVFYDECFDLYISGTAAIKGEASFQSNDIENQTIITIENILTLIDPDNIINQIPVDYRNHIESVDTKRLSNLRVYVKHERDIPQVMKICKKYFPDAPAIYLVADICREDLLVEIEGAALSLEIAK